MSLIIKITGSPANVLEGGIISLKTIFIDENGTEYDDDLQDYDVKYTYTIRDDKNFDDTVILPIKEEKSYGSRYDFGTLGLIENSYYAKVKVDVTKTLDESYDHPPEIINLIIEENPTTPYESGVFTFKVVAGHIQAAVNLQRTATYETGDQALWVAIRNRTGALDFSRYHNFINILFNPQWDFKPRQKCLIGRAEGIVKSGYRQEIEATLGIEDDIPLLNFHGPLAYSILKFATQVFLTLESGVLIREHDWNSHHLFDPNIEKYRLGDSSASIGQLKGRLEQYLVQFEHNPVVLPYLDRIVGALIESNPKEGLPNFEGILQYRLTHPSLLELIWSYWHEEGMLVQTMNAIALRFQNRRSSSQDPLAQLEIDPLRPLNNLLWGYIQDEHNRLTVPRRAYEYDHQYGLKLVGKAVPSLASADSRSKFIESFHNLLYRTAIFYREDAETTVIADAFPLLNALREVHLILAEGAHNQFGDLPWTARAEMLTMQWMLARPEMREFLRGRHMVPYQEEWMGAVDCMKKLQGWSDTTVTHFHELAVTGERILLSVRYGDWINIENIEEQAKNWARYWKPEIQRYIHGYMTVTGVDLMSETSDSRDAATRFQQPSMLLQRRLPASGQASKAIPMARLAGAISSEVSGFAELPMPRRGRLLNYRDDE